MSEVRRAPAADPVALAHPGDLSEDTRQLCVHPAARPVPAGPRFARVPAQDGVHEMRRQVHGSVDRDPIGVVTLTQATAADSEFAYQVKRAAFRTYIEQVWGWDEAEQHQLHERRFSKQEFRIAQASGRDVGVMAIVREDDCLKLNQLFILPEHQSKGIGSRCMALLMDEARRLGLPVRLRVLKVNPRALRFYERLGFVRTGETETHVLMQG